MGGTAGGRAEWGLAEGGPGGRAEVVVVWKSGELGEDRETRGRRESYFRAMGFV